MKDLIRPELRAQVSRWREALIGGAVALLGVYWAAASFGLLVWVGLVTATLGTALTVLGIRRARFPTTGDGPGMVDVDERQITYLTGGIGGGVVFIDGLTRVEYDPNAQNFILHSDGAPPLLVPAQARGADQLMDAFTPLPGVRLDLPKRSHLRTISSKSETASNHMFVIWQKQRTRLH